VFGNGRGDGERALDGLISWTGGTRFCSSHVPEEPPNLWASARHSTSPGLSFPIGCWAASRHERDHSRPKRHHHPGHGHQLQSKSDRHLEATVTLKRRGFKPSTCRRRRLANQVHPLDHAEATSFEAVEIDAAGYGVAEIVLAIPGQNVHTTSAAAACSTISRRSRGWTYFTMCALPFTVFSISVSAFQVPFTVTRSPFLCSRSRKSW